MTGASPEVLRDLHVDLVRQLRRRAILWLAVFIAAVSVIVAARIVPFNSLAIVLALTALQGWRNLSEWRATAALDPLLEAARLTQGIDRERDRRVAFNARLLSRPPVVTGLLVGLVIAVTLAEWVMAGTVGRAVGRAGLVKFLVADGEWWRLISATFLHGGGMHLLGNMLALFAFGRIVEAFVPRPWLLATYVTSGIAGSLASWWWSPTTHSIGASGAVMGVVGFAAVLIWRRPDDVPEQARHHGWFVILLTLLMGALADARIDNAGHVGGVAAGACVALIALGRAGEPREHPAGLALMGAASVMALIAGAVQTVIALAGPAAPHMRAAVATRSTAVTSVTADLVRDEGALFVVLTNRSRRTLEAYDVDIAGGMVRLWRDDCCVDSAEGHPIAPGAVFRIPVRGRPGTRPRGSRTTVTAALFDDGSFEGRAERHREMLARRFEALAEATFWLALLDRTPSRSPDETLAYLERYLPIRASQSDYAPAAIDALGLPLLVLTGREKRAEFAAETERARARIAGARDALTARLAAGPAR